uniref:5-hydroxytryptamine receptor 7 n=1 Tax=Myripristis murdjan TaxID=586833 RepID=A0A668AAZ3_9TELE
NRGLCRDSSFFHTNRGTSVRQFLIGGVLTMLTLSTICGNLLVVISVCFVKKLRQPSNYLIVSLAVADLSVALAVMPFVSITDLIGGQWIFGQFFCNVFIAMDVMCCTASIMTLCVISIDRYLGITNPLTYPVRQNGCCMAKMILSVWLLSASITLPPLFGWAQNVNDGRVCLISQDFGYTVYSTAVAFYIPMSVMLIMYYRIYRAAKLRQTSHKDWRVCSRAMYSKPLNSGCYSSVFTGTKQVLLPWCIQNLEQWLLPCQTNWQIFLCT